MELLWENASPTSEFANQTVTVDLTEYDFLAVSCYMHSGCGEEFPMHIFPKDKVTKRNISGTFIDAGLSFWYTRMISSVSNNGITFASAYYSKKDSLSGTVDNKQVIPYRIYGIKL